MTGPLSADHSSFMSLETGVEPHSENSTSIIKRSPQARGKFRLYSPRTVPGREALWGARPSAHAHNIHTSFTLQALFPSWRIYVLLPPPNQEVSKGVIVTWTLNIPRPDSPKKSSGLCPVYPSHPCPLSILQSTWNIVMRVSPTKLIPCRRLTTADALRSSRLDA